MPLRIVRNPANRATWKWFFRDFCYAPKAVLLDAADGSALYVEDVEHFGFVPSKALAGRMNDGRWFVVSLQFMSYSMGKGAAVFCPDGWARCAVAFDRGLLLAAIPDEWDRHLIDKLLDFLDGPYLMEGYIDDLGEEP